MNFIDLFVSFITNPWFIVSLIFWLIVGVLVLLLRKKKGALTVFFPLLVLLKTKSLNKFIKKVAMKFPRSWRIFWTIGIFISFGFMIFAIFFFFINLINLILNPRIENAVTPLIPGVTVDLPIFAYLILPLLFILTTHEFAHGIAANTDGVEVKSTGVLGAGLFFLIGMGAFVEIDEKEMNSSKYSRKTRLRIAAAGTFVNAITSGIALLLLFNFTLLISPIYGDRVVQVDSVLKEEEGGLNYGKLSKGDVIVSLKKEGSTKGFININGDDWYSLNNLLDNNTMKIKCSPGDKLILRIYRPRIDKTIEKDITLGPRYKIGILYEYVSNSKLKINYIYSKEEDGNNYNKHLTENLIITKINGTYINVENGKTLEKFLTIFNLQELKLTSEDGKNYYIDTEFDGVLIGILTKLYWMPRDNNPLAKFLGGNFPDFLLREIMWLWIISFSVTIFNMLPLPIFDGFRMTKEVVNWGVGEDYKTKRKKKERLFYKKEENIYNLKEYRVENIESIKVLIPDKTHYEQKAEIQLGESNYKLVDKIGDGFKSSIEFNLPNNTQLEDGSMIEVLYEYWHDDKKKIKRSILYLIGLIMTLIILGNFILSYIRLGSVTFWI